MAQPYSDWLPHGAAEGDGGVFFAAGVFAKARASLFGPGSRRRETQIGLPVFAGVAAVAALFVGKCEIEVNVGVRGHGTSGAFQMLDGPIEVAEFLERAAEVVARNAAERIDLHGGEEGITRVGKVAELIVGDAEIDVRLDPGGRELDDTQIIFDGSRQSFGAVLAIERGLEKLFGRGSGHGVELGGFDGHVEREGPLLEKRIKRTLGAGRDDVNFAAEFDEAQLLNWARRGGELSFDQLDGAANAAGGDVILSDALKSAEGDKVAKAVKPFAPAGLRLHEAQALPVAETARLKS